MEKKPWEEEQAIRRTRGWVLGKGGGEPINLYLKGGKKLERDIILTKIRGEADLRF